jgi:hypothetical protein
MKVRVSEEAERWSEGCLPRLVKGRAMDEGEMYCGNLTFHGVI